MSVKEKIIEEADRLFIQFGVRSVTMDMISGNLGISKKTIYQYFKDKKELVITVLEKHLKEDEEIFLSIEGESENSIHELIMVSQCLRESMRDMKLNLMIELKKFYPEAWDMFEDFKQQVMNNSIVRVIKRGQLEGYFREDLIPEVIAAMRMEQVQSFLTKQFFPNEKYSLYEIQLHLFEHFIHGLFTLKGHQLFNQYNNVNEKQNDSLI